MKKIKVYKISYYPKNIYFLNKEELLKNNDEKNIEEYIYDNLNNPSISGTKEDFLEFARKNLEINQIVGLYIGNNTSIKLQKLKDGIELFYYDDIFYNNDKKNFKEENCINKIFEKEDFYYINKYDKEVFEEIKNRSFNIETFKTLTDFKDFFINDLLNIEKDFINPEKGNFSINIIINKKTKEKFTLNFDILLNKDKKFLNNENLYVINLFDNKYTTSLEKVYIKFRNDIEKIYTKKISNINKTRKKLLQDLNI